MKKDLIVRLVIIFLVTVGAVFWGLNFFFSKGEKSKASGETVAFSMVLDPQTATAGQSLHAHVKVTPSLTLMSRGYEFVTTFDKSNLELTKIEYKFGSVSQGIGQTDSDLATINSSGTIKLIAEITAADGSPLTQGTATELVDLTFKYNGTGAVATGSINKDTAIVYQYISSSGTLVPIPSSATATFNVNGNNTGPTVTPGGQTPTGGPSGGNTSLDLKLKFQGITTQPTTRELNSMQVRVKIGGCGLTQPTDYMTGSFSADTNAVWSGSVEGFNLPACTSGFYTVYVKGPFHVQKKVCDMVPTETAGGTYRCSEPKITLSAGANKLDFSGILMLVGDLPAQNGTVDAYDISLVRNCIGKTTSECLTGADVNRDGKVDTQDYSLIIASLSVKNDEQ